MTGYPIIIPKIVEKTLRSLPLPWVVRVVETIDMLSFYPKLGEEVSTPLGDFRRVKVWPYTLLYRFDEPTKRVIIFNL